MLVPVNALRISLLRLSLMYPKESSTLTMMENVSPYWTKAVTLSGNAPLMASPGQLGHSARYERCSVTLTLISRSMTFLRSLHTNTALSLHISKFGQVEHLSG